MSNFTEDKFVLNGPPERIRDSIEERDKARVLLLYTGGTIGMKQVDGVYEPAENYLLDRMKNFCALYDAKYKISQHDLLTNHPALATPRSISGKRIIYSIEEFRPLLDSSNMDMSEWAKIAQRIQKYYEQFDGFVVIHGTDTMAYTASALSFMLENLGKTVVITGSQIPICEQRSDGVNNLLGAMIFASHYTIPEVTLYFNNKLYRGNRSSKGKSEDIDAFHSPNAPPLATMGTRISVFWNNLYDMSRKHVLAKMTVQLNMSANVGILRLFPGVTHQIVKNFLQPPIEGVVLLSYGTGNAPDRKDLLDEFKKATDRGVVIVNITQCIEGNVSVEYAVGKSLANVGIVPGSDMTPEAALAKLSYLLGQENLSYKERVKAIQENLRGELTRSVSTTFQDLVLKDDNFLEALIHAMELTQEDEVEALKLAVLPTIMCTAAGLGKIAKLKEAIALGGYVNRPDYDGRSPLHLAACEGQYEAVEFLLSVGANVHAKDRFNNTPFTEAIRSKHEDIVKLMKRTGAHLQLPTVQIMDKVSRAIRHNDIALLKMWKIADVDFNARDTAGIAPLNLAVMLDSKECYWELLKFGANESQADTTGKTAKEMAAIFQRNFTI